MTPASGGSADCIPGQHIAWRRRTSVDINAHFQASSWKYFAAVSHREHGLAGSQDAWRLMFSRAPPCGWCTCSLSMAASISAIVLCARAIVRLWATTVPIQPQPRMAAAWRYQCVTSPTRRSADRECKSRWQFSARTCSISRMCSARIRSVLSPTPKTCISSLRVLVFSDLSPW